MELSVAVIGATPGQSAAAEATVRAVFPQAELLRVPDGAGNWAAAANAAARTARGEILLLLESAPMGHEWPAQLLATFADPEIAAVGGRVVDAAGRYRAGGALLVPMSGRSAGFALLPTTLPGSAEDAPAFCDLLARPCVGFRRSAFERITGLDERFVNGDEIFDACLRLREHELRVAEHPRIVTPLPDAAWPLPADHDERRREFLARWWSRAVPRPNDDAGRRGTILRADGATQAGRVTVPTPNTTLLVYGSPPAQPRAFAGAVERSRLRPNRVVWAVPGEPPIGTACADAVAAASELTEVRGDAYVAFMHTAAPPPPNWLGLLVEAAEYDDAIVAATLANVTLVALRLVPAHLRIDVARPLDDALASWLARAVAAGRSMRSIAATSPPERPSAIAAPAPSPARVEPAPFASIVMLSWNAPEYTEQAVRSIAEHTRFAHETIVVDNGSNAETRARLARLAGVRIHYNDRNLGFAHGCNQGAALAVGTHVVWLNNDVLVTDGWLEALLGLQERRPAVGISAPVSNNVHGHQQVPEAPTDPAHIAAFATERAVRLRGRWYRADVVMGLCLCVARAVIDEIGGFDPRYSIGNFEDVDYCVRARAAGYEIGVCEDAFVHHFGSVTFRANGVDYGGQTHANMEQFIARWHVDVNLPLSQAVLAPIRRGFTRSSDRIPLPEPPLAGVG